jgi:type IV pilus assembly protein PilE
VGSNQERGARRPQWASASAQQSWQGPRAARDNGGFTLLEVMIVVAIVAVLAAIAVPIYTEHIRRGKVSEVTSVLGEGRTRKEQFFLDNMTYAGSPCPASTKSFKVECTTAATTYTISATGLTDMDGFVYTVNQANDRTTAGPYGSGTCWLFKKGESC